MSKCSFFTGVHAQKHISVLKFESVSANFSDTKILGMEYIGVMLKANICLVILHFLVCPGQWKSLVDIFQHCPVFLISSLLWFLSLHWFSKWPYYWNKPFWRYGERKMGKVALEKINGINLTLIILFFKLWSLPLEQWTLNNNNALLFYYVYCTRFSNLSNVCSNIFFLL